MLLSDEDEDGNDVCGGGVMLRLWLKHEEEASDAEDVAAACRGSKQGGAMYVGVDAEETDDVEDHDVAADEDEECK